MASEDPPEPLEARAQDRVTGVMLVSGLVIVALFLLAVLAPGLRVAEVLEPTPWGYLRSLPLPLLGVGAVATSTYMAMAFHYFARFIWGRGQSGRFLYSKG